MRTPCWKKQGISTITYLLLIQALASTTMERLPRPRSFTVSVACRPASIFGGSFFRSASQANLNNQVKNININDSREDINNSNPEPPPAATAYATASTYQASSTAPASITGTRKSDTR